ncbi:MAG: efflux RND transporter periplasmic adaptor subunit [Bacteroidales bacterium]
MKAINLYNILPIICIILMYGCRKSNAPQGENPMQVNVTKPEVRNIILHKVYPGYISAQNTVNLVARVNGYLKSDPFTAGSIVKKGQLLFIIEPSQYQDDVNKAKAALENAQAQLDYAENNYVRMNEASRSDAISEIDLIKSATQLLSAKSGIKDAEAALSKAETTLSYCYITAPYTGRITLGTLSDGSYVAGAASPVTLATIYEEVLMHAYFNIEDNQYLKMLMTKGLKHSTATDSVIVNLQPPFPRKYKAKIDYVSPNIDLSTGTLRLRAEIDNRKGELKDGMYANISLPYGEMDSALLIKDASIGNDQLGSYIYIVNDSSFVSYRHIEIGEIVNDTMRYVTNGLSANEMYVTRALLKVREGMKVKPVIKP